MKKICLIALIIGMFGLETMVLGMDAPMPLTLTLSSSESHFSVITVTNYNNETVELFKQNTDCSVKSNAIEFLNPGNDFTILKAMLESSSKNQLYTIELKKNDATTITQSGYAQTFNLSDQRLMTLFRNYPKIEITSEDKNLKNVTIKFDIKTSGAGVFGSNIRNNSRSGSSSSSREDQNEVRNEEKSNPETAKVTRISAGEYNLPGNVMYTIESFAQNQDAQNYNLVLKQIEGDKTIITIEMDLNSIQRLSKAIDESHHTVNFMDNDKVLYAINKSDFSQWKSTIATAIENAQKNLQNSTQQKPKISSQSFLRSFFLNHPWAFPLGAIIGASLTYAAIQKGTQDKIAPFIERGLERLMHFISQASSRMKAFASRN